MNKIIAFLSTCILLLASCQRNTSTKESINYNNLAIKWSTTSTDSALYYFDKAIEADSSYLLAYQNKANLLTSLGNYGEALQQVEILSSKIENSETYKMKGLLNDLIGNHQIAQDNYLSAISEIDEEIKRVNDFAKYKKLLDKGTLYLLIDKPIEGTKLINLYHKKANIADSRKDSLIQFQQNKQTLLKLLIQP